MDPPKFSKYPSQIFKIPFLQMFLHLAPLKHYLLQNAQNTQTPLGAHVDQRREIIIAIIVEKNKVTFVHPPFLFYLFLCKKKEGHTLQSIAHSKAKTSERELTSRLSLVDSDLCLKRKKFGFLFLSSSNQSRSENLRFFDLQRRINGEWFRISF